MCFLLPYKCAQKIERERSIYKDVGFEAPLRVLTLGAIGIRFEGGFR
jgi:hypothetical protein